MFLASLLFVILQRLECCISMFQSFEASNRGQFSCRCTLDQWLDLIGVNFQVEKLNILSKSRYNVDLILVMYYVWPAEI